MNRGHLDARFYRFDFAEVVLNEMVLAAGGKKENGIDDADNENKMKDLFDGY